MALKLLIDTSACFVMGQAYADAIMAEAGVRYTTRPSGTAERVRQMSVVEQLAEDGRLRKIQLDAAREIASYWRAWTIGFSAGVANYSGEVSGGAAEPLVLRSMAARYRIWADAAEARRVRGDLSALQVTLDLVLMDRTPWELRRVYRMSDTRALRIVQESLLEYARLAGWEEADRKAA